MEDRSLPMLYRSTTFLPIYATLSNLGIAYQGQIGNEFQQPLPT
jgi:hypothetical protein